MPALHHIAVDKLARLIGTPAAPVVLDCRDDRADSRTIPAALPVASAEVAKWAPRFAGRSVVVVDADGQGAGAGVAAWLRSAGAVAEVLEGGHAAWVAAGLPLLDPKHLPARDRDGRTAWVTRARPKVDRIACPWLIRRFVDPQARFLFVAAPQVEMVAAQLGAAPFDIAGDDILWSHRGEHCTFDTMLDEFGLVGFAPLARLAAIVRGADTDRLDLAPQAAGLLAVSLGLSRMYADDLEQLEAGMLVYDALYRWCRDAQNETHDWTQHQPRGGQA